MRSRMWSTKGQKVKDVNFNAWQQRRWWGSRGRKGVVTPTNTLSLCGQRERATERQKDRQRQTETKRLKDKKTDRDKDLETGRHSDRMMTIIMMMMMMMRTTTKIMLTTMTTLADDDADDDVDPVRFGVIGVH